MEKIKSTFENDEKWMASLIDKKWAASLTEHEFEKYEALLTRYGELVAEIGKIGKKMLYTTNDTSKLLRHIREFKAINIEFKEKSDELSKLRGISIVPPECVINIYEFIKLKLWAFGHEALKRSNIKGDFR